MIFYVFLRAFVGNDPIKSWGNGGGGSGGIQSKYLGESGVQTYFEVELNNFVF